MDQSTLKKVNRFFGCLIEDEVVILNEEGVCVASSAERNIGATINLNKLTKLNKIYLENNLTIFYDKEKYNKKELEFIKSLAKLIFRQYLDKFSQPAKTLKQIITTLIEGPVNEGKIKSFEQDAKDLELNLQVKRAAILIELKDFERENLVIGENSNYTKEDVVEDWENNISSILNNFFSGDAQIVTLYIGNNQFVAFKEIDGNAENFNRYMKSAYHSIFGQLLKPDNSNLLVSFSNAHPGAAGFYESYREAKQALQVGQKFSTEKNQSFYYGDLGTLRIITEEDIEKKKSFAKEVLEPLDKETLRITLEVFFNENMDIKITAKKLKVHPNTVNYRLGKIAEELALDPKVFKQAFELRIALLTDQIFK